MHCRERRLLQDTLTAVRLHTTLEAAGLHLFPNGERHLRPLPVLARLYPQDLLDATVRIAGRCQFDSTGIRYEYPASWSRPD